MLTTMSFLFSSSHAPINTGCADLRDQSTIVDGKPWHRRSKETVPEDTISCKTIYDCLERGKRLSENGPCLGARTGPNREYEWISYQEVEDRAHQFGAGLIYKGNDPVKNQKVAIFCSNRPEWVISDFGCMAYSMFTVPLYDTLGLQAVEYSLNQCEIATVMCDIPSKVATLLYLTDQVPSLKRIISVEPLTEESVKAAKEKDIDLITFNDILVLGKEHPCPLNPPKPDDIFTIAYTSGTTGNPKGAVLTHKAFIAMIASLIVRQSTVPINSKDVHLSFLPLAHNFERACMALFLASGSRMGYFSRDIKLITDDLITLQPTIFCVVPRLLNRIYDLVNNEVKQSMIKSQLFKWGMAAKMRDIEKFIYRQDSFWDKLIFNKIRARVGGRVRLIITGSAPLSSEVITFHRCVIGPVIEAYGQTEACAGLTTSYPGDFSVGHVGAPLPGVEMKLCDVPEMNYYAKDNVGEICVKCNFLLVEYYKQPDKTAEALDEEGWLHTGDVGSWTSDGTLKIVDRKKHIFKLAQGEYVAPEKIENVYRASPFIAQIFVDGDSFKTCLMAVVVPDEIYLEKWAPNNGFPANLKDFCKHKDAKSLIMNDMVAFAKKADLKGFEQARDISLESDPFSIENELLTPTMKNKRTALRGKYSETIAELYRLDEEAQAAVEEAKMKKSSL